MKIHGRKGIGNGCDNIPLCGFNNRRNWNHLPGGYVLPAKEFKATPAVDRCKLCEMKALTIMNRQRAAKGLPGVSNLDGGGK